MQTSPAGRAMIERFEGLRLEAYRDIVGVWTIGYGHTGPDVTPDRVITKEEADELLSHRLATEFEPGVEHAVAGVATQGQFDAMVSLAYNIGIHGFAGSHVVIHHLAGEYDAAADAFEMWDKAGGRVVEALHNRRVEEAQVYLDASPS
jgi:lysozyme